MAEVDALLSLVPEIGPIRACRRVGIPKETYYYWKRKEAGPGPRTAPAQETPGQTDEPGTPSLAQGVAR